MIAGASDGEEWCGLREATTEQAGATEAAQSSSATTSSVLIVHGASDAAASRIQLQREGLLAVGRAVDAPGLSLPDPLMSRLHLRITWDGRARGYQIGDAGSRNGLFVNGERRQGALLASGDVIRAGDTLFVYQETDSRPPVMDIGMRAARSELGIVLLGETGVGKERLARRIHGWSGRAGPFVAVNCAAIPASLAAAELFGHTRGAFSGAGQARDGLFLAAEGGTLLLDEIGDMPLELQPLVLRVLEERVLRPLGADRDLPIDVRIIAATHQDLEARCQDGRFRLDLYGRLAQVVIQLPPLRARRHEIIELTKSFSSRGLTLSADAAEALLLWSWPRNVRELRALVTAFEIASTRAALDLAYLERMHPKLAAPLSTRKSSSTPSTPPRPVDSAVRSGRPAREDLRSLLVASDGNIAAAARSLGSTRAQVYRWMKALGLANPVRSDRR